MSDDFNLIVLIIIITGQLLFICHKISLMEKNIIKEIRTQNEISETRKTIQKRSTNYLIDLYEGE